MTTGFSHKEYHDFRYCSYNIQSGILIHHISALEILLIIQSYNAFMGFPVTIFWKQSTISVSYQFCLHMSMILSRDFWFKWVLSTTILYHCCDESITSCSSSSHISFSFSVLFSILRLSLLIHIYPNSCNSFAYVLFPHALIHFKMIAFMFVVVHGINTWIYCRNSFATSQSLLCFSLHTLVAPL